MNQRLFTVIWIFAPLYILLVIPHARFTIKITHNIRLICGWSKLILVLFFISCSHSPADSRRLPASIPAGDTAAVNALVSRASSFIQTRPDSARYYINRAIVTAQSIGFAAGIARARTVQVEFERDRGNYSEGISLALHALHQYDSLHLSNESIRTRILLADIYKQMGGEKGTREYLQKALSLTREALQQSEKIQYNTGIVLSLNEQGITLRDLAGLTGRKDLMDTAFALYQRAVSIVQQTGEAGNHLGRLYNNISQVYTEHYKNYPGALEYLFKAVAFNTARNNQLSLSFNYANISNAYLRMDDYSNALRYAHGMLGITMALNAPGRKVNAYKQLAKIALQMKQYDSAYYYTLLDRTLSDSLNNVAKAGQIADMQTRYETGQKEAAIAVLHQSNAIKTQRLWLVFAAVVVLCLALALLYRQKKKLQGQQAQITAQAERQKWLIKELHHRVKNNLQVVSSLLNLQSHRIKDAEGKAAVHESRLRVQAMSLIHQRLYQVEDVTSVNFSLYINDLVQMLATAYGRSLEGMDLRVTVEKEFLDVDTAMPLALLANEVITNAFKYAYEQVAQPALHISLSKNDGQLLLSIADNGPGTRDMNTHAGFGTKLIDALTRQLLAECRVETSGGMRYFFTIPYQSKS